jgi:outer membrane protein OmpA-like peptidoglycan-associated protein
MAVQYGKCTNRAGCTLAYTGDQIRFEGAPICPECGQPLAVIKGGGGGGNKLWLLILLAVVLIGMVAAGYFIVQAVLSTTTKTTTSPSPTATVATTATTATTAATTPIASVTPNPSTTPDQGQSPAPPGSPSPNVSETPAGGSVDANPKKVSASDLEKTRQQVITRLKAMPRMSDSEKDKLEKKIQNASSMELQLVVHFEIGRSMIGKPEVDKLMSLLNDQKLKDKAADPTLVFVVAGYADKSGSPGGNFALSNERAESIARLMKNAGITNVIHTVAMGGQDILDTRPDQNRAVEIWSVLP